MVQTFTLLSPSIPTSLSLFPLFTGLSLKTQELTALFTAVRLGCSVYMEGDIHTVLDSLTLAFTLWVIYMIRFKLKASYMAELDTTPHYYVVVPCAVLTIFVHPYTKHPVITRILWAFCVYLESISVLPQLRLMKKAKLIEPFTAHYVFALGIARLLGCAHWVISVYETAGTYLFLLGSGLLCSCSGADCFGYQQCCSLRLFKLSFLQISVTIM